MSCDQEDSLSLLEELLVLYFHDWSWGL
uniref:Uncharacterized protein n=1 Tax=Anguilla anguilla TaxID=7936 RepID=A0A0E9UR39_ANGAN